MLFSDSLGSLSDTSGNFSDILGNDFNRLGSSQFYGRVLAVGGNAFAFSLGMA